MNKSALVVLGTIALSVLCIPARSAEPVTIFGIPLGERFTVPQCREQHPINVGATCWTYEFASDLEMRSMHFADRPLLGYDITMFVHNEIMDVVTMETSGISSQDYTMDQLIEKFGKPVHFEKVPVQNRMGAHFVVDRAEWDSPRYHVRFDADASDGGTHDGTVDKGWISIETHQRYAEGIKKREQFLKSRTKL